MWTGEEFLEFWLRTPTQWLNPSKSCVRTLRRRFSGLCWMAAEGALDHWQETIEGTVALVLLLDALPARIYAGTALAWDGQRRARQIASAAIEKGRDRNLSAECRLWLYHPFSQSERQVDQTRAAELFASLETLLLTASPAPQSFVEAPSMFSADSALKADSSISLDWPLADRQRFFAQVHERQQTVARFHRLPERNRALGRAVLPEEATWLAERSGCFDA